jgi:hypothetical protein
MEDDKRFWDVIGFACKHEFGPDFQRAWRSALVAALMTLPPDEIARFDRWFDDRTDALYSHDHWAAAYVINGGASDDGFYYFQCWLVGMGKQVYDAALADPDSLAEVLPGVTCEASIYSAARAAWIAQGNGDDYESAYAAVERAGRVRQLAGEDWDYDDDDEFRRRFPRLAALHGIGQEEDLPEGDDWE